MRDQPDLFGRSTYPNAPGHRGVPTSVAAAESIRPVMGAQQAKIVAFLQERGARGATYAEVCAGTGLATPSVCGRMVELVAAKRVVISAETRLTPSHRKARVYKIAGLTATL